MNLHILTMTYFIVVACRLAAITIGKDTEMEKLRELWVFGLAPVYYMFAFAADWIGNTGEIRELHYFRNMLFHVVYFPAVLAVLYLHSDDLTGPYAHVDGNDLWVELRWKMLFISASVEVLSIYTCHGGFVIGFGQSVVGVLAFGIFAHYGMQMPQDDAFWVLITEFTKDTAFYYVVGRVVAGVLWADAKLWYRLTRASPAFVELMAGVTNQDQMQVRAAIEAMSDMTSMSPTDHISNNINVKDREGRTIVHEAAVRADNQILRTILDFPGINVNICDKRGQTPLYMAVRFGDLNKEERDANIRALMASGASSMVGDDEEDDLTFEVEEPENPTKVKAPSKSKSKSKSKPKAPKSVPLAEDLVEMYECEHCGEYDGYDLAEVEAHEAVCPANPANKKAAKSKAKKKSAATPRKSSKSKASGLFSDSEGEESAPASPKPKRSLRKRGK